MELQTALDKLCTGPKGVSLSNAHRSSVEAGVFQFLETGKVEIPCKACRERSLTAVKAPGTPSSLLRPQCFQVGSCSCPGALMETEQTVERIHWGLAHIWVSTLNEGHRDGDKEGGCWLAHYLEDCISVIKKKKKHLSVRISLAR